MKYEYQLLYYVHDTLRQESINVAILFNSPDEKIIRFGIRSELRNLKSIFLDFEPAHLANYLKGLKGSFEEYQSQYPDAYPSYGGLEKFALEVLPFDESSIQWGRKGSGITENSSETFERLMDRFVLQQSVSEKAAAHTLQTRSDYAVWGTFKKELKQRNMLNWFKPTEIMVSGFKEEIKYSYQNGALHCLRPISLDIASAENMLEKIYRTKGWHEAIIENNPNKEFRFYYLLGKPQRVDLLASFNDAYKILSRDTNAVLITEDRAAELPNIITKQVSSSH
jgi:hypothetical protein